MDTQTTQAKPQTFKLDQLKPYVRALGDLWMVKLFTEEECEAGGMVFDPPCAYADVYLGDWLTFRVDEDGEWEFLIQGQCVKHPENGEWVRGKHDHVFDMVVAWVQVLEARKSPSPCSSGP